MVVAKLVASAVAGTAIAVAASVLTPAIALPWLAAKDVSVSVLSGDIGLVVIESLLVAFAPAFGRWLPGGAVAALTGVATRDGGQLPMWAGPVLSASYGLVFATAGTRFVLQRDVA